MKAVHINLIGTAVTEEPLTAYIGYFDSLYLGHQKLIKEVKRVAARRNTRCALITFDSDPWCMIRGLQDTAHIALMEQRIRTAEAMGIKYWIILDFSREMTDLTLQDFHEKVLKPLRSGTLVCGYNLHYGRKGEGDAQPLYEQTDLDVHVIDQVNSKHRKISSSRIEELIQEGDMEKVARFMGCQHDMEGSVKEGSHVGRKNGFSVANLRLRELYVMPKKSVYVGTAKMPGTWHRAMMNVSNNLTYNCQKAGSIETYLLDFDQDIYEEPVIFRFLSYTRKERKFPDARAPDEQLERDPATTRSYSEKGEESVPCD